MAACRATRAIPFIWVRKNVRRATVEYARRGCQAAHLVAAQHEVPARRIIS